MKVCTIQTLITYTKETLSQSGLAVLMSGHLMFHSKENVWKWNVTFTITGGLVHQEDTMVAIVVSVNRTWHEQKKRRTETKKNRWIYT